MDVTFNNNLPSVFQNLANVDNYDYNIFELNDLIDRHTLTFLATEIFTKLGYFQDKLLVEDKFKGFLKEVTKGYDRNITYHNDLHAGDVLQTCHVILLRGDVTNKLKLKSIDNISLLLSCIVHDFKHPGLNNMYHINAKTFYAVRYNGIY